MDGATAVTLPRGVWRGATRIRDVQVGALSDAEQLAVADQAAHVLPAHAATLILERSVSSPGADGAERRAFVRGLTLGDREALLLHVRRMTLGDRMDAIVSCPSCGERLELALDASSLLVEPYADAAPDYRETIEEPGLRADFTFRLPTGADQEEAAELARRDPAAAESALVAACVSEASIDGVERPLAALPDAVIGALSAAVERLDPQAEIALDNVCPACAAHFDAIFDTTTYLLEELRTRADSLLREVHTLALHYHWSERDILALPAERRARYLDLVAGAPVSDREGLS